MESFLTGKRPDAGGSGTANTVVGSTAAVVGLLGATAVSSAAPIAGFIVGIAGAGIAAGALYRKLTENKPEIINLR
jgi:hypothetical protein